MDYENKKQTNKKLKIYKSVLQPPKQKHNHPKKIKMLHLAILPGHLDLSLKWPFVEKQTRFFWKIVELKRSSFNMEKGLSCLYGDLAIGQH